MSWYWFKIKLEQTFLWIRKKLVYINYKFKKLIQLNIVFWKSISSTRKFVFTDPQDDLLQMAA